MTRKTTHTARGVSRHHVHLVELASLLATAGLADAFADVFGLRRHGASVLIALGAALIAGTVGHHVWLRRTDHAPPADAATEAVLSSTATPSASSASSAPSASSSTAVPSASAFWRIRTRIDNTPGRLAVLAGALAAAGANIHALEAHPASSGVIDEFLVETAQSATTEQLAAAVRAVGGREITAVPADVLALLDAPTRALELAARLVLAPESFVDALADLLDARDVAVAAPDESGAPAAEWIEGTTLVLRRADGATFTVSRPGVPFTATELTRARALAAFAHRLASAPASSPPATLTRCCST